MSQRTLVHHGADVAVCKTSIWEKELTKFVSQLRVLVGLKSCSAQKSSAYSQSKFNQSSSLRIFTPSLLNSTTDAVTEKWTSVIDGLPSAVLQTWCQPPTPPTWTSLRWLTRCLSGPPMQAGWSFSRLSSPLITCVSMAMRLVTVDEVEESDVVQFLQTELQFRFIQ